MLSGCTKATRNDKCDKGVLERPKQREIIVFREGASERVRERERGLEEEGDEIRGIKASCDACTASDHYSLSRVCVGLGS